MVLAVLFTVSVAVTAVVPVIAGGAVAELAEAHAALGDVALRSA
jgi:hypothetical protein